MKYRLIGLTSLALATLSACTTSSSVVQCARGEYGPRSGPALVGIGYGTTMTPISLDSFQFTSAGLAEQIAVQHLSSQRTANDSVRVAARLVNCADEPRVLGLRVSFMDRNQAPSESPSAWQTVIAQPRSTVVYDETSIGRGEVAHYLIEVRDAR